MSFDNYIKNYGHRANDVSLAIPTIGEDREMLLERINAFRNTTIPDFKKMERKIFEKRKSREKYVSDNFRTWVPFGKIIFNKLLRIARDYIPVRETRRFFYTMGTFWIRKSLLELGKRLKFLEKPENIFFLTNNELEKAVLRPKQLNQREVIAQVGKRRKKWEKQVKQSLPEKVIL